VYPVQQLRLVSDCMGHRCSFGSRPGGSEGQFFGQVGDAHFVSRCDETKWGAFRLHVGQ